MFAYSLQLIGAYLLGSIPFAVVITYLIKRVDVRNYGSGNAGATNVYRVAGPVAAILTLLFDAGKGAAAVLIARFLFPEVEWLQLLSGLAALLGHIFPIYISFKGGKGVATLLGVFLVLLPLETLICAAIFGIVFAITRIVALGSIIAGVSLSLIVVIEQLAIGINISPAILSACLLVSLVVLFTHRTNIKRLVKGEERRLSR
jgi:glycerol-3-phosphate acyltransferase PlsY